MISNAAELLFCGCVLSTRVQTFLAEDKPHSEILLSQDGMMRISKESRVRLRLKFAQSLHKII